MSKQEFSMWGEVFDLRKKYLSIVNTESNRQLLIDDGEALLNKQPQDLYDLCYELVWSVLHAFERKEEVSEATI